jgi:hypothetical protein
VSRAFGQLAVRRHFISGFAWAIAGEATALAARPAPPTFKKSRRFICFLPSVLPDQWTTVLRRLADFSDGRCWIVFLQYGP